MAKSDLEEKFLILWKNYYPNAPLPVREFRFHPPRLFRFDFAFIDNKIAIEIEGGLYMAKSGHTNIKGYISNCDKNNLWVSDGWKVFRFTEKHLRERPQESLLAVFSALTSPLP